MIHRKTSKVLLMLLVLSFVTELTLTSIVGAENNSLQATIVLEPPFHEPYSSEDFILSVKTNLTLSQEQELVTLPVDVEANMRNVNPLFDPLQGWCLAYNGYNSSLQIKNNATAPLNQTLVITLKAKFYPGEVVYGKDWYALISNGGDWSKAPLALLFGWADSNRVLTLVIDGVRQVTIKTTIKDYNWYNITLILSNDKLLKLYVENQILYSGLINSYPEIKSDDFYIGCLDGGIYPLNGCLQSVNIKFTNNDNIDNSLSTSFVNLDLGAVYWRLLRSSDGVEYSCVLTAFANSSALLWRESVPGKYYYKVELVDVKNYSIAISSPVSVWVKPENSRGMESQPFIFVFFFIVLCGLIIFSYKKNR